MKRSLSPSAMASSSARASSQPSAFQRLIIQSAAGATAGRAVNVGGLIVGRRHGRNEIVDEHRVRRLRIEREMHKNQSGCSRGGAFRLRHPAPALLARRTSTISRKPNLLQLGNGIDTRRAAARDCRSSLANVEMPAGCFLGDALGADSHDHERDGGEHRPSREVGPDAWTELYLLSTACRRFGVVLKHRARASKAIA